MSNNNFESNVNLDDLSKITGKTIEEIEDLINFCNTYYDWKKRNNEMQYDNLTMQNNLKNIIPYLKIFIESYKNLKIYNNVFRNTLDNKPYSPSVIESNLLNLNQEESKKLSNKLNNLNLIINANTSSEVYDSIINYTYLALNLNLFIIQENKKLAEEIETRRTNSTNKNLELIENNLELKKKVDELTNNTVDQKEYNKLQEQNTNLKERLESLRIQVDNLQKELNSINSQYDIASAKVTRLESELEENKKEKESLESKIKELNSKNFEFLKKIKTLDDNENKQSSEMSILKKNIQSYIGQISLQKSIHDKDLSRLNEEINRLKEEIKNLESKIDELKKLETRNNNLVENNKKLKSQIKSLELKIKEYNNKNQSTLNDLEKTNRIVAELQNEINRLKSQLYENSNFVHYHKLIIYSIYNALRDTLKDTAHKDKFYHCLYKFYSHYLFLINIKSPNDNYLDDILKAKEAYEILSKINTLYGENFLNDFYKKLDNCAINAQYKIQYIEFNSSDDTISLNKIGCNQIKYELENAYFLENRYYRIEFSQDIYDIINREQIIILKYNSCDELISIDELFKSEDNISNFLKNTKSSFEIEKKDSNSISNEKFIIANTIIKNIFNNKELFLRIYYSIILNKKFNQKKNNEQKDWYLNLIYNLSINGEKNSCIINFFNNMKAMEGQDINEDIYKKISIDDFSVVFMNFFKLINFFYKHLEVKDKKFIGFFINNPNKDININEIMANNDSYNNINIELCSSHYNMSVKFDDKNAEKISNRQYTLRSQGKKEAIGNALIKFIKNINFFNNIIQDQEGLSEDLNQIIQKYPLARYNSSLDIKDLILDCFSRGALKYNDEYLKNFIIDIRTFITKHNIFCDFGENFKNDTNNYITEENKLKQGVTIDERNIDKILADMMHKILILIFNKNNTNNFVIDKINELKKIVNHNTISGFNIKTVEKINPGGKKNK